MTRRVDAYLGHGLAYYTRGSLDRADEDFTQALTLRPNNAPALCSRGLVRPDLGHIHDPTLLRGAAHQVELLMAGMVTRFLPFSACNRGFLAEGLVGQPHLLTANIPFVAPSTRRVTRTIAYVLSCLVSMRRSSWPG